MKWFVCKYGFLQKAHLCDLYVMLQMYSFSVLHHFSLYRFMSLLILKVYASAFYFPYFGYGGCMQCNKFRASLGFSAGCSLIAACISRWPSRGGSSTSSWV